MRAKSLGQEIVREQGLNWRIGVRRIGVTTNGRAGGVAARRAGKNLAWAERREAQEKPKLKAARAEGAEELAPARSRFPSLVPPKPNAPFLARLQRSF
jgi:hypothetical protein